MGPSCCPPVSWCKRFNVDNAWLKSERLLTGWVSFPDLLREIHQFLPVVKVFCFWHSVGVYLVLQERPMHDKLLHLDCVESSVHGKHDLARIDHGFLCSPSFRISFSSYGPDDILFFSGSFPYLWPWGLPFLITYSGLERRSIVFYNENVDWATVSFKRCPHVQ